MADTQRSPRADPSPKRADEVLEAAAELVAAQGFDATTMQDVANAVGLLKGSLYYYFSSKDELLLRIIEPGYRAGMDRVAQAMEMEGTGAHRIRHFVRSHCEFVMDHRTSFTVWMRDFDKLSSERREQVRAVGDSYEESFRTLLRQGVEEGDVDPRLDVGLLSTSVVGLLNSLIQWYRPEGRLSAQDVVDHLEAFVMAGISSDQAVKEAGGIERLRDTPPN